MLGEQISQREKQIPYDLTYVRNLKETKPNRDTENRSLVARGGGWEKGTHHCTGWPGSGPEHLPSPSSCSRPADASPSSTLGPGEKRTHEVESGLPGPIPLHHDSTGSNSRARTGVWDGGDYEVGRVLAGVCGGSGLPAPCLPFLSREGQRDPSLSLSAPAPVDSQVCRAH